MGRDANKGTQGLGSMFGRGMALLAEARARLTDDRVATGLDAPARAGLSVLLLDLSAALLLLRTAAEGDMAPARAREAAGQLDLPGQVAQALTPALREARAPALQVVLLQVSALAAQVLALLDALADPAPCRRDVPSADLSPCAVPPEAAGEEANGAQKEKPRRRPAGRPRLHLVSSQDGP